MKGNYDHVATFYDRLSKFVYGDAIVNAQRFLIESIPANSNILIIGGGTGWIIEEISQKHSAELQITYVELSEKMIALSEKRDFGNNKVCFINHSIQDAQFHQLFDIVITPFLFDNFSTDTTEMVFKKVDNFLSPGGIWLFADFQVNEIFWQKAMLKIMYFFFRLFCGIESDRLPDTRSLFNNYGYKIVSSKTFFKRFIYSIVYKKQIG